MTRKEFDECLVLLSEVGYDSPLMNLHEFLSKALNGGICPRPCVDDKPCVETRELDYSEFCRGSKTCLILPLDDE